MLGHRQLSAAEYLEIGRRHWKVAAASLILGSAAGYSLTRMIPPQYVSTATVAAVASGSYGAAIPAGGMTASQLAKLRRQTLSPERLQGLAARFAPAGPGTEKHSGSDAMIHLENNIVLSPAPSGFSVSYSAADPSAAQQVCAELAAFFVQQEQKILLQDAGERPGANASAPGNAVPDYLASQMADAKRNLDQREAKLAEFKRQHAGELTGPERSAAEKKIADQERQLQAIDQALQNAMQQRAALTESLFAQQSAAIETRKPAGTPTVEALEEQLAAAQAQLASLETRYTPDHPDVVKQRNDIEQLQKKIQEARKAAAANAANTPGAAPSADPRQTARLQAQIQELDAFIQDKTREQGSLQQETLIARARLNTGSILDEEYRELTSEAATARTQYSGLLARQSEARSASAAAAPPREALVRVALPADLPVRPSYPDPVLFTLGGAASGLAIGLVAIVAGEMRDKSMRTAGDVEFFLELPTLAVIPPAEVSKASSRESGGLRGGHTGNRGEKQESVLADV